MSKFEYRCSTIYKNELYRCIETARNEGDAREGASRRWECEGKDIIIENTNKRKAV